MPSEGRGHRFESCRARQIHESHLRGGFRVFDSSDIRYGFSANGPQARGEVRQIGRIADLDV